MDENDQDLEKIGDVVDWVELRKKALKPNRPKHRPPSKAELQHRREVRNDKIFEREERRDRELEKLEPIAIEVLRDQLEHPDPRVAQAAAKIIIDHKWGRPTQKQELKTDATVTKVVYESAAITYDDEEIA